MGLLKRLKEAIPADLPLRVLWHRFEGMLGAVLYRFPSWKMRVIGITGTDGKTTTSQMVVAILRAGGRTVGLSSTTHFQVGEKRWENATHQTTLGRFHLNKLMRHMVREHCDTAVIEVTSHALHQGRTAGVAFDCACITNISHEHLDYHHTLENYIAAKRILFQGLHGSRKKDHVPKVAVVNLDIPEWHTFANVQCDEVYGYTTDPNKKAHVTETVWASDIHASREGITFDLHIQNATVAIALPLVGAFNVSNALAAAAICFSQGISIDIIKNALDTFHFAEGRMQRIDEGQPFDVYVDFAVTPGALENVYRSVRELTHGRIISVFGATGQRDKTKWPKIGALAATMTDLVVVTDDEPYTDDPQMLRSLVMEQFDTLRKHQGTDYVEIPDRRNAIAYALHEAKPGDAVIITGMGNFNYRVIGTEHVPWNDIEVARELLRETHD